MSQTEEQVLREIAVEEAWLSQFETPAASAEFRGRLRQAVRDELAGRNGRTIAHVRWQSWHGTLAAAAVLLLGMGLAWYSTRVETGAVVVNVDDSHDVTAVEQGVHEVLAALPTSDAGISELDELSYGDSWALDGTSLYDAFESAFAEESNSNLNSDEPGASSRMDDFRIRNGDVS